MKTLRRLAVPACALFLVVGARASASEAPSSAAPKPPPDKIVATAPPKVQQDTSADLDLLKTLHDKKILTDEEYAALVQRAQARQDSDVAAQKRLDDALIRIEQQGPPPGEPKKDAITIKHKPGGGFTFETADKRFSTTVGGWAQIRSQYTNFDDTSVDDDWKFEVKRARIFLEGHVFEEWFKYKFEMDLVGQSEVTTISTIEDGDGDVIAVNSSRNKVTELKDGYFDIVPYEEFGAKVGQYKVPFSRQELISDSRQALPERSITNDFFAPGRDVGVDLHGSFEKRFFYDLGIFNANANNGSAENRTIANTGGTDMLYNARVSVMALGEDAKYLFDQAGDTKRVQEALWGLETAYIWDTSSNEITQLELSTIFKGYGLAFEGAYLTRQIDVDGGPNVDDSGYYAQLGYMFTEHVEGVYRNARIHLDGGDHVDENTLGANYYFYDHNLKLQGSYSRLGSNDNGGGREYDELWIVQVQARF